MINKKEEYKYNPYGTYYNDICHSYNMELDFDMTLFDRKGEFNNNNMSLCEANCTYKGYDNDNKKAKCECPIKTTFNFFSDINIDIDKLLYKFISIKKTLNFNVVKCSNLLFSKKGLVLNIGSYTIISITFLSVIISILFCIKGFNLLYSLMYTISKNISTKNNNMAKRFNTKNVPPKNKRINQSKQKLIFYTSQKAIDVNKDMNDIDIHPIINSDNSNKKVKIKSDKEKTDTVNIIHE